MFEEEFADRETGGLRNALFIKRIYCSPNEIESHAQLLSRGTGIDYFTGMGARRNIERRFFNEDVYAYSILMPGALGQIFSPDAGSS